MPLAPIDDRDAGICETPAGTLLATTFTSLAYEPVLARAEGWAPEKLERWKAVNRRATEGQRKELLGTWMRRSTAGGMTLPSASTATVWSSRWSRPVNTVAGAPW